MHISTGKHLSELCKAEYPKFVKYCLWLLAEFAVICADIPEGKTIKLSFQQQQQKKKQKQKQKQIQKQNKNDILTFMHVLILSF